MHFGIRGEAYPLPVVIKTVRSPLLFESFVESLNHSHMTQMRVPLNQNIVR